MTNLKKNHKKSIIFGGNKHYIPNNILAEMRIISPFFSIHIPLLYSTEKKKKNKRNKIYLAKNSVGEMIQMIFLMIVQTELFERECSLYFIVHRYLGRMRN